MSVIEFPSQPKLEKLLTVRDIAQLLGVKPKTVYEWIKKKEIHCHVRVGKNIRFLPEEFAEWLRKKGANYGKAKT